ncbi:MAG: large subunit ribosomal protein [Candidatus Atribacteria bacterium]|nr:large subunit ribosomal protein [Candidatus Atribacteria bacterium]
MSVEEKRAKRDKRHRRIRKKVRGSMECPRLAVFRSLRHIYGQIIDDDEGKTLVAVSSLSAEIKGKSGSKAEVAKEVGKLLAQKAQEKGIESVVFDRGGYKYHGRVKALAEGAREGGLRF